MPDPKRKKKSNANPTERNCPCWTGLEREKKPVRDWKVSVSHLPGRSCAVLDEVRVEAVDASFLTPPCPTNCRGRRTPQQHQSFRIAIMGTLPFIHTNANDDDDDDDERQREGKGRRNHRGKGSDQKKLASPTKSVADFLKVCTKLEPTFLPHMMIGSTGTGMMEVPHYQF